DLAIHSGLHTNPGPGIGFTDHNRSHRAKSIKAFGPAPLTVLLLQIAGGHIIDAGITENIWAHILISFHLEARFANHYPEFAFIVHALRNHWAYHRLSRR